MTRKRIADAGTWESAISSDSIAQAGIRLGQPTLHNNTCYWLEGRPAERGRTVLVMRDHIGNHVDLTPEPYDVRSRVHEYGGGAYLVTTDKCFFVNAKDQGIYSIEAGAIQRVFQQQQLRFADLVYDQLRNRLIAVAENHAGTNGEPENFLCAIDLTSGTLTALHRGADFYSSPVLDKNGNRLAWLCWQHPNMPWDETQLHLATFGRTGGQLENITIVRDGESIFQPMFGPDERLYYCGDRDNWWNIYALDANHNCEQITCEQAELGTAQWISGLSLYGFANDQTLVAARVTQGVWDCVRVDLNTKQLVKIDPWPYSAIDHLMVSDNQCIGLFGHATAVGAVVKYSLSRNDFDLVQSASTVTLDAEWISGAQVVSFATTSGDTAYGFFYAPKNPGFELAVQQSPPLIVTVHGGPTTASTAGLNTRFQYWTSRGFAVLDVNYRGSTGYGRDYRQKLKGNWGLHDVQDCIAGAKYLIGKNLANPGQIFIMGGSAGGYTVLCALAYTNFFSGGISLYGIGDLKVLADDTHKFEARYADSLIGPYEKTLYRKRSPLFHAENISVPVLFFQGTEDKVVPPNQTEDMVAALKKHRVPTAYVSMIGEGHGFRRSDSIATLMTATLEFLCRVMGVNYPSGKSVLHIFNQGNLPDSNN